MDEAKKILINESEAFKKTYSAWKDKERHDQIQQQQQQQSAASFPSSTGGTAAPQASTASGGFSSDLLGLENELANIQVISVLI